MSGRRNAAELIPGGVAPPGDIPEAIFRTATATFLASRRVDMQQLAADLGIGRATLYRRVGGRDPLLAAILWFLTRRSIDSALKKHQSLRGGERIVAIIDAFMRDVRREPALDRFLDQEPAAALRVLTGPGSPVQQGTIEIVRRMLEDETQAGSLSLELDAQTLAIVIVRVGECFLYADVIANNEPDVDRATAVIARLVGAA